MKMFLIALTFSLSLMAKENTTEVTIYVPPMRGILTSDSSVSQHPAAVIARTGETTKRLKLLRNHYTAPVHVPKGSALKLLYPSSSDKEGTVYLEYPIPIEPTHVLLFLDLSVTDDKGRPQVESYDISPTSVPVGQHTFFNRLDHILRLTVDDENYDIDPGDTVSIQVEEARKRFFLQELSGKRGRRYTGAVYTMEKQGMLHIVSPDKRSNRRLDVRSLQGSK